MSKRCQKEIKEHLNIGSVKSAVISPKIDQNFVLDIVVGSSNAKRWNELKTEFSCKTNEEFTTLLLDFAQKQLKHSKQNGQNKNVQVQTSKTEKNTKFNKSKSSKSKLNKHPKNNEKEKINNIKKEHPQSDKIKVETEDTDLQKKISKNTCCEESINETEPVGNLESQFNENVPVNQILNNSLPDDIKKVADTVENTKNTTKVNSRKKMKEVKQKMSKKIEKTKKSDHDIRKAPELNVQAIIDTNKEDLKNTDTSVVNEKERVAIKIKMCSNCGTRHIQDYCPLQNPHNVVIDSLSYSEWTDKYKTLNDVNKKADDSNDEFLHQNEIENKCNNLTYTFMSLPNELCFDDSNTVHGLSVFAKTDVKEFTQFGPLVGKTTKEVDISEDSTMKYLWEIHTDKSQIYISTENLEESNWIRFMRPAPTKDEKNISAVTKNNQLFFVTTKNICAGEELVYWQDNPVSMGKKKMEKTSCGGCNMTFEHPLYYRTHCSVFHDIRYSLTIRKYHCKVCGAAVLGKENIMKHAAELHKGQGAYQCQFCKKFFLRLNYLEMHRTYGCSANPHRSRPLCDFCGRKFCQPQKLKVHIKRMHSDMAEVLKEFQCKSCLKILGSRAALQRHLKEVHHKQIDGACACSRCGKLFQNKSNLKIHMLTHSGIKPFRCAESNCNAAFTTKQCLQFHYKKVHGFTGEMMPKIERSVDYTFEAYSGLEDQEGHNKNDKSTCIMVQNEMSGLADSNYDGSDDDDDDTSFDEKNIDDPPPLHSPIPIVQEHSSRSNASPPTLEAYTQNSINTGNMKVLSKGSKKWIGEEPLPILKTDSYQIDQTRKLDDTGNISIDVDDSQNYEHSKLNTNLNTFNRHESSNASLLVEAALDSVCSEPTNIDMDVTSTPNCTDSLVNNLYTLAHPDNLSDVTYSHSVDVNETRDINLISPSVNDQISVTDNLSDELRHNQNIGIDYSTFHQDDFSPPNSPDLQQRNNFVRDYIVNPVSPQDTQNYDTNQSKTVSPVASPPRYNFGHTVTTDHLSSDDSNGIGAQNLSLNNSKNDVQLDLSIYKSPYSLEASSYQLRKDFRMKFDIDNNTERKHVYVLEVDDVSKNYNDETNNLDHESVENMEQNELGDKDFDNVQNSELKTKETNLDSVRSKYDDDMPNDIRNKFELDLDFRLKSYENGENGNVRSRNLYEGNIDTDFRLKNYDLIDSSDVRNKSYDGLIESDFRTDRNFEPLLLNSSELQGLDMSARSYHNYTNLNRYHPLYPDVERPTVDLRLNYSPPTTSYTHADILRVVSLDLTPPGRHSVDLSLRTHSLHQIASSRLLTEHSLQTNSHRLLDQSRLLNSDLSASRHLGSDSRLISMSESTNRILSDHTTNRLLSNDQISSNRLISTEQNRLISDESRIISDQPRLLEQGRLISESRILPHSVPSETISPVPYVGYPVSPSPYHPTPLAPRPHVSSPSPSPYPHYSAYY